jgi:hypothetical protein
VAFSALHPVLQDCVINHGEALKLSDWSVGELPELVIGKVAIEPKIVLPGGITSQPVSVKNYHVDTTI